MLSLGEESSTKMWDAFLRQLMEASLVRQFIVKHEKNHINTTGKFSDKECDPYLLTCPLKINTYISKYQRDPKPAEVSRKAKFNQASNEAINLREGHEFF